jgi:hypothetical protein
MRPIDLRWNNPNAIVSDVMRMLRARDQAIRRVPDRAIRRGVFELLKLVQGTVPKVTSTLVRSITAVVERVSADIIEGKVGTWLEYARYLEEGTGVYGPKRRPIRITARNKRGLFWGAFDGDGNAVVRRRVTVKGIKPQANFGRAVAKFLPRYVEIIEQELARETAA